VARARLDVLPVHDRRALDSHAGDQRTGFVDAEDLGFVTGVIVRPEDSRVPEPARQSTGLTCDIRYHSGRHDPADVLVGRIRSVTSSCSGLSGGRAPFA